MPQNSPQFDPRYYQAPTPPSYDEMGVAQATISQNNQRQAAILALGQLAQENQKIQIARDELNRHTIETARSQDLEQQRLTQSGQMHGEDLGLGYARLGQEGQIAHEGSALQEKLFGLGQQGENTRQGTQISAEDRWRAASEKAASDRQTQQLTTETDIAANREAGETARSQATNDARMAETQMAIEGKHMTLDEKIANTPFKWKGQEYPRSPAAARQLARAEISDQGAHKTGQPIAPEDLANSTQDFMQMMGFQKDQTAPTPQEIQQRANEDAWNWHEQQRAAGKTPSLQEFDTFRANRMKELGGEAPAAPGAPAPAGEESGKAEQTAPPAEENAEELAKSPLASEQQRAAQIRAKQAEGEANVANLEKSWNVNWESKLGKIPKTRAEWVQAVDKAKSTPRRPPTPMEHGMINPGEASEEPLLLKYGAAKGWRWPTSNEDWNAIKAELSAKTKKD